MASETSNLESELSAPEALPSQARVEKLFKWHGSKRQLAPQIVALFPPNYERLCYVEPFCGSAAVLFAKRRSSCEVLNDLDEDLLNFLVTVKMHALELYRTLRLLPNSRLEFARLMDCGGRCSSIVRAARWWYLNQTGFGGRVSTEPRTWQNRSPTR